MDNTRENTPKHCWDCEQLKDCHQAQYMTADTETVPGFVVSELASGEYVGEHVCVCCLPKNWMDDATPMDYEECDGPQHCCTCGAPLIHSLTPDGIEYVREYIKEGAGCCRELWPMVWADLLEE